MNYSVFQVQSFWPIVVQALVLRYYCLSGLIGCDRNCLGHLTSILLPGLFNGFYDKPVLSGFALDLSQ
ncbi:MULTISPECIES: hypothetical protein [Cyanophyceae]|uniref:Uncharacterized protein n=1 Tax=Leptolyngbya subtilissima DQ-A4 TaxID=2933933 RepID=A0ABV0KBS8_9CYAN|nr:hypothetical protein [Nodosilinea sp. FACHB-141]MBD2113712.1 hypothetical protein [Nodosilinea sp. FACHB-141]